MESEEQQPAAWPDSATEALGGRRERLRAEVLGVSPPALLGSVDYARYEVLLPLMLAGVLLPAGTDYTWFMAFITIWPFCAAEYVELQQVFAAVPSAVRPSVASDVTFLQRADPTVASPAQGMSGLAELREWIEPLIAEGRRGLRIIFTVSSASSPLRLAEPTAGWPVPQSDKTPQLPTEIPPVWVAGDTALLFTAGLDDVAPAGEGLRYLAITVQSGYATMCRVQIRLTGLSPLLSAATQILLQLPGGDTLVVTPDVDGWAYSPFLPLAALGSLVIIIEWPATFFAD